MLLLSMLAGVVLKCHQFQAFQALFEALHESLIAPGTQFEAQTV